MAAIRFEYILIYSHLNPTVFNFQAADFTTTNIFTHAYIRIRFVYAYNFPYNIISCKKSWYCYVYCNFCAVNSKTKHLPQLRLKSQEEAKDEAAHIRHKHM